MENTFSDATVQGLAHLRTYAARYPTMALSEAINALDNAGVFAALDEQTDYESAEAILAESAVKDTAEALDDFNAAYAADRRPPVCTCGRPFKRSPALHAGTCPVWAAHHHLNTAKDELSRRETQSDRDAWYDMDR